MISLEDLPPEIIDLVVSLCNRQDMTVAARVCQAWRSIMQPAIWKAVIINTPTDFHRFKDGNRGMAAVKRNGHFIKHLRTRYFSILDELLITPHNMVRDGCSEPDVASVTPGSLNAACLNLESLFVDSESDPDIPAPFPHRLTQQQIQSTIVSHTSTMAPAVAFGGQHSSGSADTGATAVTTPIPPSVPLAFNEQLFGSTSIASTPIWTPTSAPVAGPLPGPSSTAAAAFQANTMAHVTPTNAILSTVANIPHNLPAWRRERPIPLPPPPLDPTNLSIILCKNAGLKMMTLNGRVVDVDHVFSRVIQDLPPGIEFLTIKGTMDPYSNTTTYDKLESCGSSPDKQDEQMDRFYRLQEIRIGGDKLNNQTITRIIRQSPAVKTFRLLTKTTISSYDLASLLRNHCNDLRELYLDSYYVSQPESDAAIVDYLSMSTKGWITVGAPNVQFGPRSVAALLKHAATLENLMIQGCSGISSSTIQQILTAATNLKRFRALAPYRSAYSMVIELDAQDLVRSKWGCLGLQVFRCKITGLPRPDIKLKMNGRPLTGVLHEYSIQDSYHIHRQVYEQLSVLTKLKELRLGFSISDPTWRENFFEDDEEEGEYSDIAQSMAREHQDRFYNAPRHLELGRQYECLALTLESGLDILRTLTELEVIDFRRMQVGFWRESEQLWAREQWKKLRAPYREFPFVDKNYVDPFWKPLDELNNRECERVCPNHEKDIMHLVPPVELSGPH